MRKRGVFLTVAACILLSGGVVLAAPGDLVGKPAPDFTGAQPFGPPVSVAQFRGKVPLVLTFWSIYCATCVEELAGLQKLYDKYGPGKVAVVAVNEDGDIGMERVRAFLDKSASSPGGRFTFPLLFDGKGEVFRAYGVSSLPTLYFVEPGGTVRSAIEGFERGKELAVMAAIEELIVAVGPEAIEAVASEAVFDLDVTVPLCGTYRDGKWHRPLDLDENRQDVVARTLAEAEEYLRREAVRLALLQMGVTLHGEDRTPGCGAPYGVELRTPWRKEGALGIFLGKLNLARVLDVEPQETLERDRDLVLYRRVKVRLPALREQLDREGYSLEACELRVRFAGATHYEEHVFLEALSCQYLYLSSIRRVSTDARGREEFLLSSHAAPEKAVESLGALDVGARNHSVELLPGGILEVSVWR